jgi:hypothetical protein
MITSAFALCQDRISAAARKMKNVKNARMEWIKKYGICREKCCQQNQTTQQYI